MSSSQPNTNAKQPAEGSESRAAFIVIGVVIALILIGLVVGAVLLALRPGPAAPSVEIIRDLLIIFMTLELIVVGLALVVLLVQIARFINLINNEIQPVLESTQETLRTVRGTAQFLSKYLAEPVLDANSAIRGVSNIVRDIDVIRKAAGSVTSATVLSPTEHPDAEPAAKGVQDGAAEAAPGAQEKPTNVQEQTPDRHEEAKSDG